MLVRGGELPVQLCSENLSGLWRIGRWHVGIQQRGSAMPLTPARSGKFSDCSEGWMWLVLSTQRLDGLCSRQLSPYSVLGPHMPATNASSRGDALATERPQ